MKKDKYYTVILLTDRVTVTVVKTILETEAKMFPYRLLMSGIQDQYPGMSVTLLNWQKVTDQEVLEITENLDTRPDIGTIIN